MRPRMQRKPSCTIDQFVCCVRREVHGGRDIEAAIDYCIDYCKETISEKEMRIISKLVEEFGEYDAQRIFERLKPLIEQSQHTYLNGCSCRVRGRGVLGEPNFVARLSPRTYKEIIRELKEREKLKKLKRIEEVLGIKL